LKQAMAVAGLIFIGYVVGHLYGNLKIFAGKEAFDSYAHYLRVLGTPVLPHDGFLWAARSVLLISLVVHVAAAITLWRRAKAARTIRYVSKPKRNSSVSARSMRWGGVALSLYIVFHLAHLTTGTIRPDGDSSSPYERVVGSFQPHNWWVVLIYMTAQVALGMHLRHGLFSALQTLGFTGSQLRRAVVQRISLALAIMTTVGFVSIPVAIFTGVV
jgi:succinate dehydrogenase / fumarate reductase cytochrome b subunit